MEGILKHDSMKKMCIKKSVQHHSETEHRFKTMEGTMSKIHYEKSLCSITGI